MTDLKIDLASNDLEIIDGELSLVQTQQELATQQVSITLKMFRGEWFANIEAGVPWIENDNNTVAIYGKVGREVFDSYIKEAILSSEYVESITKYTSELNRYTGQIVVEAEALTSTGDLVSINTAV